MWNLHSTNENVTMSCINSGSVFRKKLNQQEPQEIALEINLKSVHDSYSRTKLPRNTSRCRTSKLSLESPPASDNELDEPEPEAKQEVEQEPVVDQQGFLTCTDQAMRDAMIKQGQENPDQPLLSDGIWPPAMTGIPFSIPV